MVGPLQSKLKVPRDVGKKGSNAKISWSNKDQEIFDEVKKDYAPRWDYSVLTRIDHSFYA